MIPMFQSKYICPVLTDQSKVYKTTLVNGLQNGSHTLEIVPNGEGVVPIEALEVHRPSIR